MTAVTFLRALRRHHPPQASKELSLEKALSKMQADWSGLEFRVVPYKDTGTAVVGGTDDVQARGGRVGGVACQRVG